jgi:transcriptional regulator with XRE-family HTH domain
MLTPSCYIVNVFVDSKTPFCYYLFKGGLIMTGLSDRIKHLRIESAMTQQELADAIGVSQNAIYNWENGKREPNLKTVEKIAKAFHVSPSKLLYGELDSETAKNLDTVIYNINNNIDDAYLVKYNADNAPKIEESIKLLDDWRKIIWKNEGFNWPIVIQTLISHFLKLNAKGRSEAIKRIAELTEIKKYIDPDESTKE